MEAILKVALPALLPAATVCRPAFTVSRAAFMVSLGRGSGVLQPFTLPRAMVVRSMPRRKARRAASEWREEATVLVRGTINPSVEKLGWQNDIESIDIISQFYSQNACVALKTRRMAHAASPRASASHELSHSGSLDRIGTCPKRHSHPVSNSSGETGERLQTPVLSFHRVSNTQHHAEPSSTMHRNQDVHVPAATWPLYGASELSGDSGAQRASTRGRDRTGWRVDRDRSGRAILA